MKFINSSYFEPNQAILHRWVGIYKNIDKTIFTVNVILFGENKTEIMLRMY